MKTIHKYPLQITALQNLRLPVEARLLSAQFQGPTLMLWVLLDTDPSLELVFRTIRIIGTGNPIDDVNTDHLAFIATAQDTYFNLVWHIFEQTYNANA
jgi:hypothetical protein